MKKSIVALNMIVKDEAHVIERCIESAASLVDCVVISDTGSSDETVDKIYEVCKRLELPCAVFRDVWEDYGTNRTNALDHARHLKEHLASHGVALSVFREPFPDLDPDYALVIDADDILVVTEPGRRNAFPVADVYDFLITMMDAQEVRHEWWRPQLFKLALPWRYEDTFHEHAECALPFTRAAMPGVEYRCIGGGGRKKDPERVQKEIALLKKQLEKKPGYPRAIYYLHQTYYDNWMVADALEWGEKVLATRDGWFQERFITALRMGDIYLSEGEPEKAQVMYLRAMACDPSRGEPHERLARYYREQGRDANLEGWARLAYLFASEGSRCDGGSSPFLLDRPTHTYKLWDELAVSAFWHGRFEESARAARKILETPGVPEDILERTRVNLKMVQERIVQWGATMERQPNRRQRMAARSKERRGGRP